MHTDLRSWLDLIDNFGELKRISGFDCDLEMSAASEIISGSGINPVPCLIFDDIPGHTAGYRTLFGLFGSLKRVAITLGLPADDATRLGLLYSWRKKLP